MLIDDERDEDHDAVPSLEDVIGSAFDESATGDRESSRVELKVNTTGQAREDNGRFAAKEPSDGQTAATPSDEQPQAQGTAPAATRSAPVSWPKEQKEAFATLPPAIQDVILKREADVHKGFEERAHKVRTADEFERILSPHAATMQRLGLSPAQAVDRLLQAQARIYSDPRGALLELARTYGVNLAGASAPNPNQAANPLERQLAQMGQSLAALQAERAQERRDAETRQHDAIQSNIADFAARNEHFATVRGAMASLMQSGQAKDLQDAYDKACWLEPTIRDGLIASKTAPAAAVDQARRDQERVQRARGAASSVRGAPAGSGTPPAKKPGRSIDEDIAAAFESHG